MGNIHAGSAPGKGCCGMGRVRAKENTGYVFSGTGKELGFTNSAEDVDAKIEKHEREDDDFDFEDEDQGGELPDGYKLIPAAVIPSFGGHSEYGTKLFEEIEVHDILQGSMGNCWLIAAIAGLAEHPQYITRIFHDGPGLTKDGNYTLTLYKPENGMEKCEVTVNDLLLCAPGGGGGWGGQGYKDYGPHFCAPTGNEIWVCILEKACAKLMGGFPALNGGSSLYGWAMLTGSSDAQVFNKEGDTWSCMIIDSFDNSSSYGGFWGDSLDHDALFDKIDDLDAAKWMTYCACGSYDGGIGGEPLLDNGLVSGHAFSVISLHKLDNGVRLVQIRNPWGNEVEWSGAWCDGSPEWDTDAGRAARRSIESEGHAIGVPGDGKFWMDWEDVVENFENIGTINPNV